MKKKFLATALVLAMALTLFAGCGKSAPAEPAGTSSAGTSSAGNEPAPAAAHADEINIGIAQDLDDSLDPHYAVAAGTKEIMFNVFEGLVKPTPEGNLMPAVASDYTVSEDGLTYDFILRDGIKFHNGDEVEMEDVLYSIERNMGSDGNEALIPALEAIKDMKADGSKLTITLDEPVPELLNYLTLAILPADYDKQDTAPVGTGPYKFVSRVAQDNIVMERFDDYWGEPAKIGKVTFHVVEKIESMLLGLQGGSIDLCMHLTSTQTAQLSDGFNIEEGSMNLVQALYLNNAVAPFDNVLVRQALSYGIDKQGIIDLAFDGFGIPLGTSMFPSFAKYYDDSLTDYYPYDPAKAKELLKEAGFPDGFSMEITVPSNYQPHVDAAQVIVEQLKEIGVTAKINPIEWESWLNDVYGNRQFQSTITGLTSDNMTARKLLERFRSDMPNNFTNYNNADYDELAKAAIVSTNDEEQTALYRQMEKNLTENAANVYIQDMADLVAVRKGLSGLTFYPLYVLDVSTLYWAE
ncbi:MAG: ABC transporter substrate-binding protein [Lachnospiraceae bacterium]|nr:ABC transporter substrate-binding protein [Lachnospiraceae bacterium]